MPIARARQLVAAPFWSLNQPIDTALDDEFWQRQGKNLKKKSLQQVANETGYFVLKYGQDTRAQAPDGTMKLGKKPRNIGLDLTDSPITRFVDVTILVRQPTSAIV